MFAARLIGMEGMLKGMQLSWLDLTLLTGEKIGGWVAVHFIAFSRLLKWVYFLANFVSPDEIYQEPDSSPSAQWLVRELARWLKCCGLDTTGKKLELLDRVLGLYDKEEFQVHRVSGVVGLWSKPKKYYGQLTGNDSMGNEERYCFSRTLYEIGKMYTGIPYMLCLVGGRRG
jgi:hypothetical protein